MRRKTALRSVARRGRKIRRAYANAAGAWEMLVQFPTVFVSRMAGGSDLRIEMVQGPMLPSGWAAPSYRGIIDGSPVAVYPTLAQAQDALEAIVAPVEAPVVSVPREPTQSPAQEARELARLPDPKPTAATEAAATPIGALFREHPEESKSKAVATAERSWSPYQRAIFDEIRSGVGNVVIEAVAGSGKSTTILEATKYIDPSKSVLLVAFNKSVQIELQSKIPGSATNVRVMTLAALGFSILRRYWSARKEGESQGWVLEKTRDAAVTQAAITERIGGKDVSKVLKQIEELISLCECWMAFTDEDIANVANDYSLFGPNAESWAYEGGTERSPRLFRWSDVLGWVKGAQRHRLAEPPANANYGQRFVPYGQQDAYAQMTQNGRKPFISMRDMTFVPAATPYMEPESKYDVIIVDETQDMDKSQLAIVFRALAPGGRVIVVGDRKQAIYRFRGADSGSIERLIGELNAKVLPLSVSYRVPGCAAEAARRLVPQFEIPEGTPQGVCSRITAKQMVSMWSVGDLVISRMNSVLMPTALIALSQGITPIIMGEGPGVANDIIKITKRIAARVRDGDLGQFIGLLQDWVETEQKKVIQDTAQRLKKQAAERRTYISDAVIREKAMESPEYTQIDLIYNVFWNPERKGLTQLPGINTVDDLLKRISTLSPTEKQMENLRPEEYRELMASRLVISSVHRIKGGEANRVFLIEETFKWGERGWQKRAPKNLSDQQEEKNLWYVAVTRAQNLRGNASLGIPPKPGELYYVRGMDSLIGRDRSLLTED